MPQKKPASPPAAGVREILGFAVTKEEEAIRFYVMLAARAESPAMGRLLRQFAVEERGHRARLLAIQRGRLARGGKAGKRSAGSIPNLQLAEYLVQLEPRPGMSYQEALIVAMQREKAAFRLYTDLADGTSEPGLRETFLALAQDEARHKLRFEVEYDEQILKEN
jgi:rubrerythrin